MERESNTGWVGLQFLDGVQMHDPVALLCLRQKLCSSLSRGHPERHMYQQQKILLSDYDRHTPTKHLPKGKEEQVSVPQLSIAEQG